MKWYVAECNYPFCFILLHLCDFDHISYTVVGADVSSTVDLLAQGHLIQLTF